MKTWLTETFNIKYPIIMAPMFLVSSIDMLVEASKAGIMGCIPALNWRTPEEFEEGLKELKERCEGPFGINIIVNQSNIHMHKQIDLCAKYAPDFIVLYNTLLFLLSVFEALTVDIKSGAACNLLGFNKIIPRLG